MSVSVETLMRLCDRKRFPLSLEWDSDLRGGWIRGADNLFIESVYHEPATEEHNVLKLMVHCTNHFEEVLGALREAFQEICAENKDQALIDRLDDVISRADSVD